MRKKKVEKKYALNGIHLFIHNGNVMFLSLRISILAFKKKKKEEKHEKRINSVNHSNANCLSSYKREGKRALDQFCRFKNSIQVDNYEH